MNQRSNNRKLERQSYYKDLKVRNLAPLWENLDTLVPRTHATPCQSAIWKYDEIRP